MPATLDSQSPWKAPRPWLGTVQRKLMSIKVTVICCSATPDSQGGWEKRGENRRIVILTVINDDVNDDSNDDLNDDVNDDLNDDVNDNECNSSLSVL